MKLSVAASPISRALLRLIRSFLRQQGAATRHALERGRLPDLARFVTPMADAMYPVVLGMVERAAREKVRALAARRRAKGVAGFSGFSGFSSTRLITKKQRGAPPSVGGSFDVFNRRVADYARQLTFDFAESTTQYATDRLEVVYARLREDLLRHAEEGAALKEVAATVQGLFSDPARAFRIAVTEQSRIHHGGQYIAAKEWGVTGKRWLESSDACPLCLKLGAMGAIPLDKPFHVDPRGGAYSIVMHPPAHPHCFCAMEDEF